MNSVRRRWVLAIIALLVVSGIAFSLIVPIHSELAIRTIDYECIGFNTEPTIPTVRYHILTGQLLAYRRLNVISAQGCTGGQVPQRAELFL